jgi:hypothetical protein
MDVNKIRIITLGNMKGDGDLMLKPASKNEPEKIFVRKGSTTIFHKLADKIRGIQHAPYNIEVSLLNQFERSERVLENRSENLIKFKNSLENLKTYKKTTYDANNNVQGQYEKSDVEIIFAPKSLSSAEIRDREKNLQLFHSSTTSIKSSTEIKFNPEKKELKNKFKVEVKNLLPKDKLKISKDHKNYSDFTKKLDHLEIEIESFSSFVVNQGIDKGIKNNNAQTIAKIEAQKKDLKKELKAALAITEINDQLITSLMTDFSTKLDKLTNQYLENSKV